MPVLRYGSTDSLFWYAMEPLDSASLREMLTTRRRMGPRSCRRIITQVVSALEYLHRRGVVHGAIKPENVFVDKEGWVHLCDPTFARPRGTARATPAHGVVQPRRSSLPAPTGARPSWIAPEEFERGERLPAADQFALAALVYECLSGTAPTDAPEPLHRLRSDVPVSIARAVDRALAPDPWQRFPSCADFLWALEENASAAPQARPTSKIAQEVVMITDWEPPADPWKPMLVIGRVAVGLVAAAVLWFSAPYVWQLIRQDPTGQVSVANTAPASLPTPALEAAPSAAAVGAPPPDDGAATWRVAPRSGNTSTLPPPREQRPAPTFAPVRTTPPPTAAGSARLFINSTPWGQLYVDGTLIGNTPKADLELSAGTHALRVVRAGFITFERTVRVAPGETLRLTDIVLEPSRP